MTKAEIVNLITKRTKKEQSVVIEVIDEIVNVVGENYWQKKAEIVNETSKRTDKEKAIVNTNLKSHGSGSSVFFHETLDEFLNFYVNKTITDNSPKFNKVYNMNLVNAIKGWLLRTGSDHQ